jgi:hypothetical protein
VELAVLARAPLTRALAAWLLAGAALVGVERLARPAAPELSPLTVEVAADASPEAVDRQVREAVLLDAAHRLGWARTDPVVTRVLQEAMGVAEPEAGAEQRVADALALGLDLTDATVRARLLDRAERALAEVDEAPDDAALEAWRAEHADRFRTPDRWRVDVVGVPAGADPAERLARLRAGEAAPEGEPRAGGRRRELLTSGQLAGRYGAGVEAAVAAATPGAWSGPVDTPAGALLLRVVERVDGAPAPLDAVRAAVRADWRAARARQLAAARWAELRSSRRVDVVRR